MFSKELDISSFNTDNVKDMSHMFSKCSSLEELNFSFFNNNKDTDMRCMFDKCSNKLKMKFKSKIIS